MKTLYFIAFLTLLGCTPTEKAPLNPAPNPPPIVQLVQETPKETPPTPKKEEKPITINVIIQNITTKEPTVPNNITFNRFDDFANIPITLGNTIKIKLDEDINDQFNWGIVQPHNLEIISNTTQKDGQPRSGTKTRTITLQATKPGVTNLRMYYYQTGKESTATHEYIDSYQLNIRILQ